MTLDEEISEKARLTILQVARNVVSMDSKGMWRPPTDRDLDVIERDLGDESPPRDMLRVLLLRAFEEERASHRDLEARLWEHAGRDLHTYLHALHGCGQIPLREDFVTQFLERPTSEIRMLRTAFHESLIMGIKRSKVVVDRIYYGHGYASRLLEITELRWEKVLRAYRWPKALGKIFNSKELEWYARSMREAAPGFTGRVQRVGGASRKDGRGSP